MRASYIAYYKSLSIYEEKPGDQGTVDRYKSFYDAVIATDHLRSNQVSKELAANIVLTRTVIQAQPEGHRAILLGARPIHFLVTCGDDP